MKLSVRWASLSLVLALGLGAVACGGGGGGAGGGGGGGGPSADARLLGLTVSAGTLSPAFASAVTDYTVTPALLHALVHVTPTVVATGATIMVGGFPVASGTASVQVPLGLGSTPVAVVVTAPDGTTMRTYTVVFTRNRSALSSMTTSAGASVPVFSSQTLSYGVQLGMLTASTTVTATAADPAATIKINSLTTASGAPSASIDLSPGLTPVTVEVTAGDGITKTTYTVVFERTFTGQEAYLKASNPGAGDSFGVSVALSGATLVVGAMFEYSSATGVDGNQADNGARDSGAAYVFVRSGTTWTQQAYLKASNTGISDYFGCSVAISGDTLVVGAYGEDSNTRGVDGNQADDSLQSSGAAYVFVRNGTTWSQQAYLKASNTRSTDLFGVSVAISEATVVVGAYNESSDATGVDGDQVNNRATESGAAYVFVRSGTTWSQQAYLKASNTGAFDKFGQCVAVSGETVVVGAYLERSNATGVDGNQADNSANSSGAAYVFVRNGTTWSQQAYLKASNTATGDEFGYSVAISGDTVVVGAVKEDSAAVGVNGDQADNFRGDSGAAYVFVRNGTTWSQQAYLKASSTGSGDNFGFSVALDDDILVVGAYLEDSSATGMNGDQADDGAENSGAAYVFSRNGTTWSQQAYFKASNTEAWDRLGYHVAVAGDTAVVGALGEASSAPFTTSDQGNNDAVNSGAAYVLR